MGGIFTHFLAINMAREGSNRALRKIKLVPKWWGTNSAEPTLAPPVVAGRT